jgi:hypothetical protein
MEEKVYNTWMLTLLQLTFTSLLNDYTLAMKYLINSIKLFTNKYKNPIIIHGVIV